MILHWTLVTSPPFLNISGSVKLTLECFGDTEDDGEGDEGQVEAVLLVSLEAELRTGDT